MFVWKCFAEVCARRDSLTLVAVNGEPIQPEHWAGDGTERNRSVVPPAHPKARPELRCRPDVVKTTLQCAEDLDTQAHAVIFCHAEHVSGSVVKNRIKVQNSASYFISSLQNLTQRRRFDLLPQVSFECACATL